MSENAPERIWAELDGDDLIIHNGDPELEVLIATGDLHEYIRADLAAPTVKPLEWYPSPDDDTDFCADALGVTYVVDCDLNGFCSWGFFRKVGREGGDYDWSIDDAKAAAQADYQRRVLNALK